MDPPPVEYARTADGYSVAFAELGSGTPLLQISGAFGHFRRYWEVPLIRSYYESLGAVFRHIVYDTRGQGSSSRGLPEDLNLTDFEKDIDAIGAHLHLDRFVLIAPGPFGQLGVHYAATHPERLIALVLWQYADYVDWPGAEALFELASQNFDYFLDGIERTGEVPKAVLLDAVTQADHLKMARLWRTSDVTALLPSIKTPTLLFARSTGGFPSNREAAGKRIAASIPGAKLLLYDDPTAGFASLKGETAPGIFALQRLIGEARADLPPVQTDSSLGSSSLLSSRELEVLALIAAGRSNAQIADALVISTNTVSRHVSNIFDKIGATNRVEATVYARDHGLA